MSDGDNWRAQLLVRNEHGDYFGRRSYNRWQKLTDTAQGGEVKTTADLEEFERLDVIVDADRRNVEADYQRARQRKYTGIVGGKLMDIVEQVNAAEEETRRADQAERERDEAAQELNRAAHDWNRMLERAGKAERERDETWKERDKLSAELNQALAKITHLNGQLDAALVRAADAEDERDEAQQSYSDVNQQLDEARVNCQQAIDERYKVLQERDQFKHTLQPTQHHDNPQPNPTPYADRAFTDLAADESSFEGIHTEGVTVAAPASFEGNQRLQRDRNEFNRPGDR